MKPLPLRRRHVRLLLAFCIYALLCAVAISAAAAPGGPDGSSTTRPSKEDRQAQAEKRRQAKRMYSLFDHIVRICLCTFLSAVFAGLTLGVMCADTFTLEIIAESGPAPDCKYAAQVLPLRKQGHKTLCTLIVSNMLCNTLIVQEFSSVFDIIYAIRTHGNTNIVVDDSGSQLLNFAVSTFVILVFAEIVPMSICKSKYSLRVAAAGSIFVRVAMVLTYPVSAPLGQFLDWVVGTEETGQVYDRKELRKLMMLHYDHERGNVDMPKSELNLLLAAMDFQECRVKDIMTPIAQTTYVNENDVITPDFVERLWLSGCSRVPVESACDGHFCDVLVVKDLLTINISPDEDPLTVANVVKARNRLFVMVGENTTLPAMLKFFQDAKTHMAVVFAEDAEGDHAAPPDTGSPEGTRDAPHVDAPREPHTAVEGEAARGASVAAADFSATARRSFAKTFQPHSPRVQGAHTVGIVTMEDVVEELLNDEIYDEYDSYDTDVGRQALESPASHAGAARQPVRTPLNDSNAEESHLPPEPTKPPRANFYSYFTHPELDLALTDAQVWAVAYYLSRTVKAFMLWPPPFIKALLDDTQDTQLVSPAIRHSSIGGDPSNTPATAGVNSSWNSAAITTSTRGKPPGDESLSTPTSTSAAAVPVIDLRSEHTLESSAPVNGVGFSAADSSSQRAMQRFDHARFLSQAAAEPFVMYTMGAPSEYFTLVLGGQVDMLVGRERFYSRLRSLQFIGEEALTDSFYVPDFSAIVSRAARVYRISKAKYERFLSLQALRQRMHSHLRVLRAPQSATNLANLGTPTTVTNRAPSAKRRDRSSPARGGERDRLLQRAASGPTLDSGAHQAAVAYGTFKKDK